MPAELIETLLTAATYAPSAHNRQPWRFVVLTSPESKHELATAMGQKLQADLEADNVPESVIAQDRSPLL
ncbi:MAG: hypothetical protein HC804_14910 [Anaerolineae bacterium]|nr:hypothetical protein [Anaerolineae bacterium]